MFVKKVLAILLSTVFALALFAGCGEKKSSAPPLSFMTASFLK
jgi:hypothetical protein